MVDPLSLTALGAAALTQGIGFLYGQVTELLRRRRERQEAAVEAAAQPPVAVPADAGEGQALAGELSPGPVDDAALEKHADQLARLKGLLGPYRDGDLAIDPADRQLLEQVAALRSLLEEVYRQHITFPGERRPPTGSALQESREDVGSSVNQVIASGQRAAAIGRDAHGPVITGNVGDPGVLRPPASES